MWVRIAVAQSAGTRAFRSGDESALKALSVTASPSLQVHQGSPEVCKGCIVFTREQLTELTSLILKQDLVRLRSTIQQLKLKRRDSWRSHCRMTTSAPEMVGRGSAAQNFGMIHTQVALVCLGLYPGPGFYLLSSREVWVNIGCGIRSERSSCI